MSNPKRKKRRNPIVKFIKIVVSMVLVFLTVSASAIFAYSRIVGFQEAEGKEPTQGSQMNIVDALMKKNIALNVAVFGVDADGTRTDVIFIVHFDSKSGNLKLMSVPRDTRVTISDTMYAYLKANNKYIPSNRTCKINEVHAYAGKEKANEFSVIQIEELLGIKIDHYVKVNFGGVVDLVDLIGGVDFYVPQDMKWDMSDTGDITINLKEGQQVLDGSKALQLLRFRRYPEGDVARVRVQQSFLMAVAQKLLSETNLVTTLPGLMKAAYDYVETDLLLSDALKYVQYASDVKISSLETETLPGVGQMVNGISYYLHDSVETKVSVKKVFFSDDVVTGDVSTESSKDKVIEVANGGGRSGIAGENQEMLISEGYNVEKVSNYNGEKTTYTRIYVRNQGEGEDLRSYYTGSKLMVDEDFIDEGIDILIILGTEE